ncbi:hypothetical protein ABK040_006133 [Willaertia magna]
MATYQVTEKDIKNFNPNEEFTFDEPEVTLDEDYSNIIVIDGLPIIDPSKEESLKSKVSQIIEKKANGTVINFVVPYNEKNISKGFAFVELEDGEQAKNALSIIKDFPFAKFTLNTIAIEEIDKYEKFDETSFKAQQPSKTYKERDNLVSWLKDPQARSQYAIRFDNTVEVCWNDPLNDSDIVHSREKWSDGKIEWSPHGSYLVTYHDKGVALWGGEEFKIQDTLTHKKVHSVQFSPNESYAVTVSENPPKAILWDLRAQRMAMSFPFKEKNDTKGQIFKWSANEKYFARIGEDHILIFETETMSLVGGKPFIVTGVKDFSFAPKGRSLLAYYTASTPASVIIIDVGAKCKEVRSRNYFNIVDAKLKWQEHGDYLVIAVSREQTVQNEKIVTSTFDVVRVNEKGSPIESISGFDDVIEDFDFEPRGDTLAVIHGPGNIKKTLSFFSFKGNTHKALKKFENKSITKIFWSPRGNDLVVANTKLVTVPLEFYNVDSDAQIVGYGEHFSMTDACWDPSGRYFTTYVSSERRANDNGYIIWTFLGRILHQVNVDKLYEFKWRNRIPSLLTANLEKEVKKRLPQKKVEIEQKQKERQQKLKEEKLREKKKLWDDFQNVLTRLREEYERMKPELVKLRGYDDDEEEIIEVIEEPIDE